MLRNNFYFLLPFLLSAKDVHKGEDGLGTGDGRSGLKVFHSIFCEFCSQFFVRKKGFSYRDLKLWKGTFLCFHSFRVEIRGFVVPTADSSLAHCTPHSQSLSEEFDFTL